MNNDSYKIVSATYPYFGYKIFEYAKTTYCNALGFVELKPEENIKRLDGIISYDHRKTAFIYNCFSDYFVKHYPLQLDLFKDSIDFKIYFNNHYNNFDDLNLDEKEYEVAFVWEEFLDKHLKNLTDINGNRSWFVKGVIHLVSSNSSNDLTGTRDSMLNKINEYLQNYFYNN